MQQPEPTYSYDLYPVTTQRLMQQQHGDTLMQVTAQVWNHDQTILQGSIVLDATDPALWDLFGEPGTALVVSIERAIPVAAHPT